MGHCRRLELSSQLDKRPIRRKLAAQLNHDFIIVGAGSAGCVLANRLSADPSHQVLLLEAGGPDKRREIHIPAAFSRLFKTEVDWAYETLPQPNLNDRCLYWPRGRVLGGSSSINAMIYVRGHPSIYDSWAAAGNKGWSWEEVLPYFKRSENFEGGESEFHGRGGSLNVTELRDPNPLSSAFVEAAVQAGLSRNTDFNAMTQEGAGLYHVTQRGGKRCSAAGAFLKPVLGRSNLTVKTGALATRILFEGRRAIGVEYLLDGELRRVHGGAIVLCGGALNSPQLLMLSGIGPPRRLEAVGVGVRADLPGVGENLQDHLAFLVGCECTQPISLANAESVGSLLRYLVLKRGPLTSNVAEAGAFVSLQDDQTAPDLQFHFGPAWFVNHGFGNPPGHGLSLGPTLIRPASRGSLWLASADPTVAPAIDPRYLSIPDDLKILVTGIELARVILAQPAFEEYLGPERFPGGEYNSREALEKAVRQQVESLYHPVGTCKMGHDSDAVVDDRLRVHGVENLTVADASVTPLIPNGNTNAVSLMIGEKAADLIAQEARG